MRRRTFDETAELKAKAVVELLAKAGIKAGEGVWPSYIAKRLKTKDGFSSLCEEIKGLMDGDRELTYLEDSTPVFEKL